MTQYRVAIEFKASPDVLIGPRPIPETWDQQWRMNDGRLAPDISTSFASNTYLEIAENHPNPSPGRTDEMVRALADRRRQALIIGLGRLAR